jgi:ABC-type glycerol-3-phosphate transport system substrate-binding protein
MSFGYAQTSQIELWTFIDPGQDNVRSETLAHIIETFEANNPGITVVANVIQWQELDPTLLRASMAGQVPDVAMLFSPSMPAHIAANTLTPLNEFVEAWSEEMQADMIILPEATGSDGTIYGLPWEMRVSGIMYRQDLLDEAGYELPQSLQELAEIATEISSQDLAGIALGFSPRAPSIASSWFLTTLVGMGEQVLNEDGTASFATPSAERLVTWVYDLVHEHDQALPLDVALLGNEETQQLFIAGRAAFLPSSTQRLEFIRESGAFGSSLQMMPYQTFETGQAAPALVQSWSAIIPRGAPNPDDAWKFIEHWTSTEMQSYQAQHAGYLPVRTSVLSDPWFQTDEAAPLSWAVEYAATNPLEFDFPEDTVALYDVWARMFERVLTGQMGANEALEWAETEYNSGMRR